MRTTERTIRAVAIEDASKLSGGDVLMHRSGTLVQLLARKVGLAAWPHRGWLIHGGGGLADYVAEREWLLIVAEAFDG